MPVIAFVYLLFVFYKKKSDFSLPEMFFQTPTYVIVFSGIGIVFLGVLNWIVEAYKWKYLLEPHYSLSVAGSTKIVLAGLSLGLLTPKRAGEWFSRAAFVPAQIRWQAILQTFIGSISQLLVTIIFGSCSLILVFFIYSTQNEVLITAYIQYLIPVLLFVGFIIMLVFRSRFLNYIEKKIPGLKSGEIRKSFIGKPFKGALLLSSIRYLIFSLQFVLTLVLFGCSLSVFLILLGVCIVYLFLTLMPLSFIGDTVVRGPVAVFVFTDFFPLLIPHSTASSQSAGVLSATMLIWFINILLPALIGIVASFTLKSQKA